MEGGREGGEGVMEGGMAENYYCRAKVMEKFLFHFNRSVCCLRTFCIFNDLAAILLPFRRSWHANLQYFWFNKQSRARVPAR